ncbi:MAG: hypothetical protein Q8L14_38170 [Myxococcales bacterium]|nr:hypothetical protein [Myxococcales bacterium]
MSHRHLVLSASALLAACPMDLPSPDAGESTDAGLTDAGDPCEVNTILWTRCVGCHSAAGPGDGVFTSLDAMRLTPPDGGARYAERALARIVDPVKPMPPPGVPQLTAQEKATFAAWVADGAQPKTCSPPPLRSSGLPTDGGVTCSSGVFWHNPGDRSGNVIASGAGASKMFSGRACIGCHDAFTARGQDGGYPFLIAGTLYATAHEADDCDGFPGRADAGELPDLRVRITDANGVVYTRAVNSSGGFGVWESVAPNFAFPYTAAVLYQGRERRMLTPQRNGDCNACHTVFGEQGAPGRIVIP